MQRCLELVIIISSLLKQFDFEKDMNEDIFGKLYALQESIAHGYQPTEKEIDFMRFAEEKITDWTSDVEQIF